MVEIVITLLAFIAIGEYCLIFYLLGEKNRVEKEKDERLETERQKLKQQYEEALECRPHLWEKYNYKPKKPIDPNLRWKFDSMGDPIYYRVDENKK